MRTDARSVDLLSIWLGVGHSRSLTFVFLGVPGHPRGLGLIAFHFYVRVDGPPHCVLDLLDGFGELCLS